MPKRAGAGRKPGVPNKATAEIQELARSYAPGVLKEMARIATKSESDTARVAAGNVILDRAYGKARQTVEHEMDLSGLTLEQLELLAATLATARPASPASAQGAGRDRAPTALN